MHTRGPGITVLLAASLSAAASDVPQLTSTLIASGLDNPTYAAAPTGITDRIWVVEKRGRIQLVIDGVTQPTPFLNIDGTVPDETWNGMIGLCFDPDWDDNGWFYVHHTIGQGTSSGIRIARYTRSTTNPNVADPTSGTTVLQLDYPDVSAHHVGGWLGFGPDGLLYIPLGDGGIGAGASAGARSQSIDSLWGKVLRIDVHGPDAYPTDDTRNYALPPDNPFVGSGQPEIWALGLRNPFRGDFDAVTGDLYLADVGHFTAEEINLIPARSTGGENFGWDCAEGIQCTPNGNCVCDGYLSGPLYEYSHAMGCSISGGALYRGCTMPGLDGRFFYGDWCAARVWSGIRAGSTLTDIRNHTSEINANGGPNIGSVTAVCRDGAGELIVVSQQGHLLRIEPQDGTNPCHVVGDIDDDGDVDADDILALLADWGPCGPIGPCPADLNEDGVVDVDDILLLLNAWTT